MPSATTCPPFDPGGRPHIHHVIGGEDRVLVVLHHQHRVAEIAQPAQRAEQPFVVALVQADRRLVQHIQHAGQPRADLAGEPDALALPARQRGRAARQGQVIEPDIDQEAQALDNLAQDAPGDLGALRRQRVHHGVEPRQRGADRQLRRLGDVLAGDADRKRLWLQPRAMTGVAGTFGLVAC